MSNRPLPAFAPSTYVPPGEPILEPAQKIALLRIRRSAWSEAILDRLPRFRRYHLTRETFVSLERLGLAIPKGNFHVLTAAGRWRADKIAMEWARSNGIHAITYDDGGPGRAGKATCTCGWSAFRSRHVGNSSGLLSRDAHHHLTHVGAVKVQP